MATSPGQAQHGPAGLEQDTTTTCAQAPVRTVAVLAGRFRIAGGSLLVLFLAAVGGYVLAGLQGKNRRQVGPEVSGPSRQVCRSRPQSATDDHKRRKTQKRQARNEAHDDA